MSEKPNKDQKIINLLAHTLQKLGDFAGKHKEAESYAAEVVKAVRASAAEVEEFRDQVMGIIANVPHLNGELVSSDGGVSPAELATMQLPEMLSRKQKREQERLARKRAKEQIDYDRTSMLCKKCGLIRADRLNINELALDSEESGSHFDYNFDNVCDCGSSSSSSSSEDDEEGEEASSVNGRAETDVSDANGGAPAKKRARAENGSDAGGKDSEAS